MQNPTPPPPPGPRWVAPDTPAEPASGGPRAPGAGPVATAARAARPIAVAPVAVPRPIPLRPLTLIDVLDGAFAACKARPRTFVLVALPFIVPVQLLTAFLQRNIGGGQSVFATVRDSTAVFGTGADGLSPVAAVADVVLGSVALVLITGAVAHVVSGWLQGVDPSAGAALRAVAGRAPALVIAWLLVHILEVLALAGLVVGAVVVMALLVVTAPAVAIEGVGPLAGIGRSWRLCRTAFWRAVGFAVLSGFVLSVVGSVFSLVPLAIAGAIGFDRAWPIVAASGIVTAMVLVPLLGAATVFFYLDLRMRAEGLDLELAATEHFPQVDAEA